MQQFAFLVQFPMTFKGLSGGLQQLAFAAANEIVPKKNRGQTLAFMSFVSIPGSCFGGPIGMLDFDEPFACQD